MDVMLVPGPPGTLTPPLSDPETRTIDDEELKRELAFELHSDPITSIEDHDEEEATNRNMDGAGDGPPSPVEEEIVPDHYYGGQVPVFKPTMDQFRSFKDFMSKIDKYGMKSGIVKVIPPKEWTDALPPLDEAVKTIKVKNPIEQIISGEGGRYSQANMEKQRTYNLPQWRKLSSEEHRQPPAQRGERRQNTVARAKRGAGKKASVGSEPPSASAKATASVGRAGTRSKKLAQFPDLPVLEPDDETTSHGDDDTLGPSTPKDSGSETHPVSNDVDLNSDPKSGGGQPKSISARRKYNRKADAGIINEDDFVGFDYRLSEEEAARFNPERCEWLESKYWQQLTYSSAMYGADQPGSLFADSTTEWNVAHLPNVLDVLGQKIPGVNTAYLYVGMWRSTFAWHLEDVDLYSINYIHFGAPKQWYSISQKDLRRFEAVMKSTWPNEAKHCSQFLRHKTFLISPDILEKKHGISVNRLVHNQGEFVITFPYGYHSGYNLGYNCAESVNFATEAWLDFGSKAQKCMCVDDSVWVDSEFIRRRLNGEPDTEEDTDHFEDDEYDEDDADRASASKLPTPPESVEGKSRTGRKRKRVAEEKKPSAKKLCLTLKRPRAEPCVLCPNDPSHEPLLPTDTKQNAHRICGLYTHETAVYTTAGSSRTAKEAIVGIKSIDKDRLKLKCNFCRVVKGACFQCSVTKCTKAFHATCAAAAGVLVEVAPVPYFGADGVEYQDMGCHFRCKVHRPKRPKHFEISSLESEDHLYTYCRALKPNDTVQALFGTENRDIFAGVVKANNHSEESLVISPLPQRTNSLTTIEVEYKYVLRPPTQQESMLPRPSPTAAWFDHKARNANALRKSGGRRLDEPQHGEPFNDPSSVHVWEDYQCAPDFSNPDQAKVDIGQRNRLWYYLPKTSTESKAHYTDDPQNPQPNVQAHPFPNDLLQANRPKATMSARTLPIPRASIALSNPVTPKTPKPPPPAPIPIKVSESPNNRNPKPYIYKPKEPVKPELKHTASGSPTTAQQNHGPGVPTLTAQLPPPDPPKPCAPGPIERWLNAPLPSSKAERDASSENYLRRFPLSLDNNNHLTSGDGHSIGFGHQSMNHVMNNATLMDHGLMHTGNYQAHHRNTSTLSLPPKKLIQHARKTKSARHDQKVAIDRLDRLIAGNPGHDGRMANHQPSLSMGVMSGMGSLEQMAHIAPIAPVAPMAPMAPMLKINNQWNLDEGNIPSPGSAAHRFLNLDGTSGGGTPTPSHPGTTKRMSVSEKSDNGAFDPPSPDQADSPEGVEFDDSLNDVFDPFQEGALFRSHESDCYKSLYRSGGGFTEAAPACRR